MASYIDEYLKEKYKISGLNCFELKTPHTSNIVLFTNADENKYLDDLCINRNKHF